MTTATKPFIPSAWLLNQQMAQAMAKCDASVAQAKARAEARADARAERFWIAEAAAKRHRSLYGATL